MSGTFSGEGSPKARIPIMYQRWRNLLFLHWRVSAAVIDRTLPPGLHVDTFGGSAWIGIVPFFMKSVRPRFLPPVPGISDFLELNLRTYVVDADGNPGVWFYSLDANQRLAVVLARSCFHLPYVFARMESQEDEDGWIDFASLRPGADADQRCVYRYRGRGEARCAKPKTLEYFLCERYRLFAYDPRKQKLSYGEVQHRPYPLEDADLDHWNDALFTLNGLEEPGRSPDHIIFSRGVNVLIHPLRRSVPEMDLCQAMATS